MNYQDRKNIAELERRAEWLTKLIQQSPNADKTRWNQREHAAILWAVKALREYEWIEASYPKIIEAARSVVQKN